MCDPTPTLSEVLRLLRTEHAEFLEAVVDGHYSFWIGSGISVATVPGVADLLRHLLISLYDASDPTKPDCPYMRALREVLEIIHKNLDDYEARHPQDWADLDEVTKLLENQYARVLGVRLRLESRTLAWDILRIQERYSDGALEPDAEHRLIAALVAEAAVSKLLTTNWDPLIERAASRMREDQQPGFSVVVHADEINGMGDHFLIKIHGCAELARTDPARYRQYLVATRAEIIAWGKADGTHAHTAPLKDLATDLLRQRNAVFLGLSGVDENLLEIANSAPIGREENYAPTPPKVAFVTDRLTDLQIDVLRKLYNEHETGFAEVERHACLTPCAKPLLAALFTHVLRRKAEALARLAETDPAFPEHLQASLRYFIERAEEYLKVTFDSIADPNQRWRSFATEVLALLARFTFLYRRQVWPDHPALYEALCTDTPASVTERAETADQGLHWLLLAIGALVIGHCEGRWRIASADNERPCHLLLERPRGWARVFIMRESTRGRLQFEAAFEDLTESKEALLIYTQESEPRRSRSLSTLTRDTPAVASTDIGEIWVSDLASESVDASSFLDALYLELAGEAA